MLRCSYSHNRFLHQFLPVRHSPGGTVATVQINQSTSVLRWARGVELRQVATGVVKDWRVDQVLRGPSIRACKQQLS